MSARRSIWLVVACLLLVLCAAPARAGERNYWRYGAGHFENTTGNQWTAKAGNDNTYHFVETARTEGYVELYDKDRDVTVRLYADRCEAKGPGTNFAFVKRFDGTWGAAAAAAVIGTWRVKMPGFGERDVKIMESVAGDGTFDTAETGTRSQGVATFRDGVLTIHWDDGMGTRGFTQWQIDRDHEHGRGKVIITQYGPEQTLGTEVIREGRKVRELTDCTLQRTGR